MFSRYEFPFRVKNRAATNLTGRLSTAVSHNHLFPTLAHRLQAFLLHPRVDDFDPMIVYNIFILHDRHISRWILSPTRLRISPGAGLEKLGNFGVHGFR